MDTMESLGGLKKPAGRLLDLHVVSKDISWRKQLLALFFEKNLVACPSSYLNFHHNWKCCSDITTISLIYDITMECPHYVTCFALQKYTVSSEVHCLTKLLQTHISG
jgi:hypothetical protein